MDNEEKPTSGSKDDSKKAYSTRKRIAAPKRYSPSPSWERWQNWKDAKATEGKKDSEERAPVGRKYKPRKKAVLPEKISPSSSLREDPVHKEIAPKKCTSTKTLKNKGKTKKRLLPLAVPEAGISKPAVLSGPKKFKPTCSEQQKSQSRYSKLKTAEPAPKKLKPAYSEPQISKSAYSGPQKSNSADLPLNVSKHLGRKTLEAADRVPKKCEPADLEAKKSKPANDESDKQKECRARKRRLGEKNTLPVTSSDGNREKKYGTREKIRAPRRYSPPPVSGRQVVSTYTEYSTYKSSCATSAKTESASSEKWADVLKRQPVVLLKRYVPPAPVSQEEDYGSEIDSGSECCTPTPSWMDESEIASYYYKSGWDTGVSSPTPSLEGGGDETIELETDSCRCTLPFDDTAEDADRKTHGPISLNDIAVDTTLKDESATQINGPVSLGDIAVGTTLIKEDGTAPSLKDTASDTTAEDTGDLKESSSVVSLNATVITTKKEMDTKKCGPILLLDDTVSVNTAKNELNVQNCGPVLSFDIPVAVPGKNGLDAEKDGPTPTSKDITTETEKTDKERVPTPTLDDTVAVTEDSALDSDDCDATLTSDDTAAVAKKTIPDSKKCAPTPTSNDTAAVTENSTSNSKSSPSPLSDDPAAVSGKNDLSSLEGGQNPFLNDSIALTMSDLHTKKANSNSSVNDTAAVVGQNNLGTRENGPNHTEPVTTTKSDSHLEKSRLTSPLSDTAAVSVKSYLDTLENGSNPSLNDPVADIGMKNDFYMMGGSISSSIDEKTLSDSRRGAPMAPLLIASPLTSRRNGSHTGGCVPAPLSDSSPRVSRRKASTTQKHDSALSSKDSVCYVLNPNIYSRFSSPDRKPTLAIGMNGLDTKRLNSVQSSVTKPSASGRQSLILIRHDYTGSAAPRGRSLSLLSEDSNDAVYSSQDTNKATIEPSPKRSLPGPLSEDSTATKEDSINLNSDLSAQDVFGLLFRQKTPKDTISEPPKSKPNVSDLTTAPLCKETEKQSRTDSETRCPSSLSDASTLTARDKCSPVLSSRDVFEIVCGSSPYSPTLFRHDTRSPGTVTPQQRKRSHSPAVSLPERSSPNDNETSRSFKRRSLSNNFEDRIRGPKKSASSLDRYERREGYATRKRRSAPKRYSPTPADLDETTNSSADNGFYFESDRKPYATRVRRSAPKRYSPTPFYDAYYYYENYPKYIKEREPSTKKSSSDSTNKLDTGNDRKVRKLSVKSVSGDNLKVDDETHWAKYHGSSCTKQCGSLMIVRDTPVPRDLNDKFRAKKTAPPQVSVADSKIPDAGNGAWASEAIPARTRFGPYEGKLVPAKVFTSYAWLIRKNGKPIRCVDATEPGLSNWMRFVNCARHDGEQNLEAFQCHGNIYYKTTRYVNPHEELLVWYGDEYGRQLGIDPAVCAEEDEASWRERNFKCPACPLAFASPLYLEGHKKMCRVLKSGAGSSKETKEASKSRKRSSSVPLRRSNSLSESVKSDKPLIKTYPGPKQLSLSPDYSEHLWDSLSLKQEEFFCEECNILFHRRYHWQRHLQTKKHGGSIRHSCFQCNKTFPAKSSLTRHLKSVHTGDTPYACTKCSRRFSDKGNLKKHLGTHTGAKRFACSKCSMTFSEKGSLKKHFSRKHRENQKNLCFCNICKMRFCDKQSLQRHQRIHNGEKPFACFVCNKRFSRREVLKTHLKIHRIGAK